VISQKNKAVLTTKLQHAKSNGTITVAVILIIELVTILLLQIPSFKAFWLYFILVPFIAGAILYVFRFPINSKKILALILISAVIYHIAILYSPPSGISIGERTPAVAKLTLEGHWDVNWRLVNPTYNPFPMDVDLFSTASMITSIPYISQLNDWVIYLPFIVAFDLVLYSITKQVTGSKTAGIFAIFLLASTPPANILLHGPKWIGALLILISAWAMIKAFKEPSRYSNIIIANVSYFAAILFHPSAVIGAFLPIGTLAIAFMGQRFTKAEVWSKILSNRLFLSASTLFGVLTLTRVIYTAGYLEGVLPAMKNFVLGMFAYTSSAEELTALYENAVSPINAYAWCIPIAMALALVVYSVWKRKAVGGVFTLIIFLVGAGFALLGLLSVILKVGGFWSAMYPAFVFFIPAAAVVGVKALKSTKALAAIMAVLMILFVGVAITDPMMSSQRYEETGATAIQSVAEDYVETQFLVGIIPSSKILVASYSIASCAGYLSVLDGRPTYEYYTDSGYALKDIRNRAINDSSILGNVTYIWPQAWYPNITAHLDNVNVNVLYDSGRNVIFEKTPYQPYFNGST
jgi:hypothetical protein